MLTTFQSIKGQAKAKKILANAIKNNKTSHAYLFKGPSGVGKKMTAHGLAALLNCYAPQKTSVCGTCPSCKKFRSGNHPDFTIIEPEGAGIKIAQIRTLQQNLAFPPFEAKTRVIILPDIHDTMHRAEVANALLKTLEEPPENTLLILTGDEAGNILPTILSRCQVVPFLPLSHDDVAEILQKDKISHAEAMTLAAISEGSPGRAQHHHKKGILELRKGIIETLMNTCSTDPNVASKVYKMAEQSSNLKNDAYEILDLFTSWLRDLIMLTTNNHEHTRLINQDMNNLNHGVKLWTTTALMTCLDTIATARKQLQRNCNRTLVFEVLFFALLDEKC